MRRFLPFLLAALASSTFAGQATPGLPPEEAVARVLKASPGVRAAGSRIEAEEANRRRLEAGPYEWNLRFGSGRRRVTPPTGPEERLGEWNAAIERPLRLPGKAAADAGIGSAGVALAESAYGDRLHEAGRSLLKAWFGWLRESAVAEQWAAQTALLDRQWKSLRRRQQLGDAAKVESLQGEAALAQAEAQLVQARLRERTAREELERRYPGLPLARPADFGELPQIHGSDAEWVERILGWSHELAMAREETRRARLAADRSRQDRLPDPSIGLHVSRERAGEESILGAYVSIPLPGEARRAEADAGAARAEAAAREEEAVARRIGAEAASLYHTATVSRAAWLSAREAARRLGQAADMTARAYELGEGSLGELLTARRLANDAELASRLGQLEALESGYRLLLDAHQIWDFD